MYRALLPSLVLASIASVAPSQSSAQTHAASSRVPVTAAPAPAATTAAQLPGANAPGSDPALAKQLLTMRDDDQTARNIGPHAHGYATNLAEIDRNLTGQLKTIVEQHGWPTISLVGLDASNAATLILTHTADHAWQRSLLPQLLALADDRKIDPAPLAFVIDKELVAEGKPQRYGTQFQAVDGQLAMIQVEDPGGLDSLRARTLLPPLPTYKADLARMYHLRASNQIIPPPPPAAPANASTTTPTPVTGATTTPAPATPTSPAH